MNNKLEYYFMNLCFFLYFIVLLSERILSLSLTFANNINILNTPFDIFVYLAISISIISFIIYVIKECPWHFVGLFKINYDVYYKINFKKLAIASCILLVSGMVHSYYTTPIIQFISYGFFIIAILLKTILINKISNEKPMLWLSFIYLICYSMAIPVCYSFPLEYNFYLVIIEVISMFIILGGFLLMTFKVFLNEGENLFLTLPFVVMLVLNLLLIILEWNASINYFLLIATISASVLFLIGSIYKTCFKKNM